MQQVGKTNRKLIEGRPALIVVDIQAETFYDRTDEAIPTMPNYPERMLKARSVIDKARTKGIPVIFIQEVHRPDLVDFGRELDGDEDVHCIETAPGTGIAVEEMGFLPTDYLVKKRRYSAFFGTDFEILLRGLSVETLILVGGLSLEAHEASLRAMEYLQTGARCSRESVLEAMDSYRSTV